MAKQRRSLNGKVVAITGGARGIGKATAEALVRRGCRVAIGDVDLALAEKTAAGLGGGSVALALDVSDRASFETFLDEAERQLGPLDVIVNNAGIMPVTPFLEESEDSFRRQIEINLIGVIHGTQLAMRRMLPRDSGHIVNIASQAGKTGIAGIATYSATKHAVVGLSESVRAELRGRKVDISCVMPTIVNTELTAGVGQKWVKPVEATDVAAAIVEALESPRFDVYVPKSNGALLRSANLMPRVAAEWVGRAMGTDKLMTEVDEGARAEYEARVTRSGGEAKADDTESSPTEERTS
jgi:NAD(P)-dependent dehydrogenase (short-subunit alcohol dehydrogenase family)